MGDGERGGAHRWWASMEAHSKLQLTQAHHPKAPLESEPRFYSCGKHRDPASAIRNRADGYPVYSAKPRGWEMSLPRLPQIAARWDVEFTTARFRGRYPIRRSQPDTYYRAWCTQEGAGRYQSARARASMFRAEATLRHVGSVSVSATALPARSCRLGRPDPGRGQTYGGLLDHARRAPLHMRSDKNGLDRTEPRPEPNARAR